VPLAALGATVAGGLLLSTRQITRGAVTWVATTAAWASTATKIIMAFRYVASGISCARKIE
jgi:hypothetical protein